MPPNGSRDGKAVYDNAATLREGSNGNASNELQGQQQEQSQSNHQPQRFTHKLPSMHTFQIPSPRKQQVGALAMPRSQQLPSHTTRVGVERSHDGVVPLQQLASPMMDPNIDPRLFTMGNPWLRPGFETRQQSPAPSDRTLEMPKLSASEALYLSKRHLPSPPGMTPSRYSIGERVHVLEEQYRSLNQGLQATGERALRTAATASQHHTHQLAHGQHQKYNSPLQPNIYARYNPFGATQKYLPQPNTQQEQHQKYEPQSPKKAIAKAAQVPFSYDEHQRANGYLPQRVRDYGSMQGNTQLHGIARQVNQYNNGHPVGYYAEAGLVGGTVELQGSFQQHPYQKYTHPLQHSVLASDADHATAQVHVRHSATGQAFNDGDHPLQPNIGHGYSQAAQVGRSEYHPEPPPQRQYTFINGSISITKTMPVPPQSVTTVTSDPNLLPKLVDGDGPINPARRRQTLAQAERFQRVATSDCCTVCKTLYGQENLVDPHGIHIKQVDGAWQWVEFNNLGAVEVPVRLPCSHIVGSNCIVPYFFCPICQTSLMYPGCGHKIPVHPADTTKLNKKFASAKLPMNCTQCRVLNEEHRAGLPVLLSEMAQLRSTLMELSGSEDQEQRLHFQHLIEEKERKIADIKAYTDDLVLAAQIGGYN